MEFIKGQWYKVKLRNGAVITGRYMDLNYNGEHLFDARPDNGTQTIPDSLIRTVEHKPNYKPRSL
jgi:hypothetical protein